jgi:hypothetical protein
MTYQRIDYHRRVGVPHVVAVPAPPPVFAGAGDIVSGAKAWWGLRSYTAAAVGTMNVIRLRRSSDNAEQDFGTVTGGGLDLTAIASFKGAANLFVVTLYDQLAGAFQELTNATAATQPALILNASGSRPAMRFTGPEFLRSGADIQMTAPYTMSWVGKRTGSFTTYMTLFGDTNGNCTGWTDTANQIFGEAPLLVPAAGLVTAADNAFHSVQCVINGASGDLNVDGVVNTVNMGNANYGGGGSRTDLNLIVARATVGDVTEAGIWDAAFSGVQSAAMAANQAQWSY